MEIRPYRSSDEDAVVEIWQQCGLTRPWNDPRKDIHRKLKVQANLFLVAVIGGRLVATVMAGYEGHRGWINYLAVAPEHRRRGIGRAIMLEVEQLLRQTACPKINLQVRSSNPEAVEFYRRLGFAIDDVVSMGKRLADDDGANR